MTLNFLTASDFKIQTAKMIFDPRGVEIISHGLSIPEIQADTNLEISRHSAYEAVRILQKPVMREDHGFFLDAFPGWPGPYMAHTEKILPAEDVLQLLKGKVRTAYFETALVYVEPGGQVLEFVSQVPCTIAQELRPGGKEYGWDSIICLGDEMRALSEYSPTERLKFFTENFERLAEALEL